ncbi:MAG: Ig-like domain-containing protein, partial [Lachnospira sp.]|nr:Ig-like domain-containing protein [Lachnospira sp.]
MKKVVEVCKLRTFWKVLGIVLLCSAIFGGVFIYVNAASSATMRLNMNNTVVQSGSASNSLYIEVFSGVDENHVDMDNPENHNTLIPSNVEWTTANSSIVTFLSNTTSTSTGYVDKVYGLQPTLYGLLAGQTSVKATYYSKTYDETGAITSSTAINSVSANVTVPLSVNFFDSYTNTPKSTIYKVGDVITIEANTTDINGLFVETRNDKTGKLSNDGVIELVSKTSNTATIKVIGGGTTYLTVRTADGDGNDQLSRTFQIRAVVELDHENPNEQGHRVQQLTTPEGKIITYMVLDQTDFAPFTYELIPTNINFPATSGVTFRTKDNKICSVSAGSIRGEKSGITTVQVGLFSKDVTGAETRDTGFDINIVVPFKKLGNNVTTMNVSDQIQLTTSAETSSVVWSTSDNTVLEVDAASGMVTAVGAGTATIYATRTQDELYTLYGLPCQLAYEITVIDGFGLSTTQASVNIDETILLTALVTTQDLINNPVSFKVENLPGADGVVPTETLVTVVQDGKTLKITGVAPGAVRITGSQVVNGVIKSEICVVYVTTPVNEISINPSFIQINRGETGTVQLLFNPPGPTNSNVIWGTSNPEVATVEGDSYTATITGVKGGTATINVISEDGLKVATCEVYIREPVTGVTLNATTVHSTMAVGHYQMVANVLPEGDGVNRNVTWSSSDPTVCTVDANGLVKFIKPGYATIICQTEDGGFIAACNFFISIPVTEIKLDYTDEIMSIGGTLRITAEVLPVEASNKLLYWESSNTNVCIVDSNGLVQAVGTGNCTILCKSADGGYTAMCNIYVKQPVTSIILNTTDITVRKGQVFWLNATCLPENADNKIVAWESRDE